jgi:hypothetical protein
VLRGASEKPVRGLGLGLAATVLQALGPAGPGVLGAPGLAAAWKLAAVAGAVASPPLVGVLRSRHFVMAPILNVGTLVAVYMGWPNT